LELALSLTFAYRLRARASCLDVGALTEEAEEIEEERESLDESETIDSGEEAVEMELASEERRVKWRWGEDVHGDHRSRE
jgi:hypothetical protein